MLTFGTMKVFLMAMAMQNGIVVALVEFRDGSDAPQAVEYRIEGCADLGDQYVTREGVTSQWKRDGARVADQIATQICGQVEALQQNM